MERFVKMVEDRDENDVFDIFWSTAVESGPVNR